MKKITFLGDKKKTKKKSGKLAKLRLGGGSTKSEKDKDDDLPESIVVALAESESQVNMGVVATTPVSVSGSGEFDISFGDGGKGEFCVFWLAFFTTVWWMCNRYMNHVLLWCPCVVFKTCNLASSVFGSFRCRSCCFGATVCHSVRAGQLVTDVQL